MNSAHPAKAWIERLGLQPHPEGGFYRETYRAALDVDLPGCGARAASTAIYFLVTSDSFSALHRIRSDELWFFHAGDPLEIHVLDTTGVQTIVPLSLDTPQAVVGAGCWFGARVARGGSFSLVSCVVAPGFDFRDFELARREKLIALYPHQREWITSLTRT